MTARFNTPLLGAAALLLAATVPGQAASAAAGFDNPTMGDAPCLVLNSYTSRTVGRGDGASYRASAEVENICDRTVDISLCFGLTEGKKAQCSTGIVRPGATATHSAGDSPVRFTGPAFEWRYLPVQ